jgi:hypothetical protein
VGRAGKVIEDASGVFKAGLTKNAIITAAVFTAVECGFYIY